MDAGSSTIGDQGWGEHAAALRRLALGLVRDGSEADELVQEVWLRARGAEARSRGWLARTLRNLVTDRARARARRAANERTAARPEAVPSAEEVLGQLEVAEQLARELARLAEPYRLVLHLRYFEDLAPDAIAARLGEPRETVRTRLRRARAELRERMDRAHGGERRPWVYALVPLVRSAEHAGPSAAIVGGIAMGTKLVVGVAVAVTAAALFFVMRGGERPAAEATPVAAARVEPEPPPSVDAGPIATPARAPAPPAAAAEEPPAAAAPAPAAAATGRQVDIRVVVEDETGVEHAAESGTLLIGVIEEEGKGEIQELAFEDGRLALDVPDGRRLVFGRLVAAGREATLPEPRPIAPGDAPILVRGKWLARGALRVIDAHTGAELDGIEVRYAEAWPANPEWTHPGDHPALKVAAADARSPVTLPERKWPTPYWVHAPGHAWTRVDFVHATGGTRTVELSTERGDVEVHCVGTPPDGTFVRLYPPGRRDAPSHTAAVSVRLAPEGPTVIEDLQPGRYLAALETGEHEARVRLGEVECVLAAGETVTVPIRLDAAPPRFETTHLRGTLRLPAGFSMGRQQMWLERLEHGQADVYLDLGDMDESEEDESLLLWDAGEVRTGAYLANLPHQFRQRFTADVAGGETRVALELPPLAEVTVEVVAAETGAPLEPDDVTWAVGPLEGVSHSTTARADRAADGTWRFLAPQGPVDVTASLHGYVDASESLDVGAPGARVTLALRRATGLRLLLRDGDAAVPRDHGFFLAVRITDARGAVVPDRLSIAGELGSFALREPGTYTLLFPPLAGYRPIPARTVEVRAGEVVDVLVPLEAE